MSTTAASRQRPKGELRMALDKSARTIDANGYLHIAATNISKATVSPYLGSELLEPGLEPDRVYWLLRDPEELAKAAPSSNNIPLLDEHVPVDPEDLPTDNMVGSTGTDAAFVAPYLRNSLVVYSAAAQADIESREKVELSCGYGFNLDMTPGVFEGMKYDGVMRDLAFNHVALVEEGRAGPDVLVADQLPKEGPMKTAKNNAKARKVADQIHAYLRGKCAKDKAPKLAEVMRLTQNVTADRFPKQVDALLGSVKTLAKGRTVKDADLDLDELKDLLSEEEDEGGDDDDLMEDADPRAKLMKMMDGKFTEDETKAICDLLDAITTPKPAAKPAADPAAPPALDEEEEPVMDKKAVDAALKLAEDRGVKRASDAAAALRQAELDVEGTLGRLSEVPKTPDGIYKLALDHLEVDLAGVDPSAYRHLFRAVKGRQAAADALPDLEPAGESLKDKLGAHTTRLVRA